MIELTDIERMALDTFISENWNRFLSVAERFLDEDEIDSLTKKLAATD